MIYSFCINGTNIGVCHQHKVPFLLSITYRDNVFTEYLDFWKIKSLKRIGTTTKNNTK